MNFNLEDFDFVYDTKKKKKHSYSLDTSCFENEKQKKLIDKLIKTIEILQDEVKELKSKIEDLTPINIFNKLEERVDDLENNL